MMRLCAILLCVGLAACATVRPPLGDEHVTPHFADGALVARDGVRLPLREWDAEDGPPKAVIVALHGMSDYSNALDGPGKAWARRGITTLAIDQRGFGRAPDPGLWAGSKAMRQDLDDFVAAAHARFPDRPLFALGESMGGAVLLTALAAPDPPAIDGAILVSPAVWSRADMPMLYRVALFLVAHTMPGLILTNSAASHVVTVVPSDNVPMLIALGKDPLFQKKTRADTLFGLVNLMDEARADAGRLNHPPPILYLHGMKDQIIPDKSAEAAIHELGSEAEVKQYPDGYHMLLRDLEAPMVRADVAHWVMKTAGGAESPREAKEPENSGNETGLRPLSLGFSPEHEMTDKKQKKHDLRDDIRVRTTITNTESRMAGGVDNPNVAIRDDEPLVAPGPSEKGSRGQDTKGD
jgi:alpha-beta hydrolase superfamily lysophospholipase